MNEYIKTAQELAKLPGTDKWPWELAEGLAEKEGTELYAIKKDSSNYGPIHGLFLRIDDFSPWSAAKWLERAGVTLLHWGWVDGEGENHHVVSLILSKTSNKIIDDWAIFPTNLDYMKVILAIGQRAFGMEILVKKLDSISGFDDWVELAFHRLNENKIDSLKEFIYPLKNSCEFKQIFDSTPYWDWTEEQRQPWLEAWNRGQDVTN